MMLKINTIEIAVSKVFIYCFFGCYNLRKMKINCCNKFLISFGQGYFVEVNDVVWSGICQRTLPAAKEERKR